MQAYTNEEHETLRKRIRAFAENVIAPRAQELDEKEEFSVELTRKMGEAGILGINMPTEYGGGGADTLSYIIAVEELARVDSSQAATVVAHNSLGLVPLLDYGSEEQKKRLLPQLTTGEHLWAFRLTEENAGSDARGTETSGAGGRPLGHQRRQTLHHQCGNAHHPGSYPAGNDPQRTGGTQADHHFGRERYAGFLDRAHAG